MMELPVVDGGPSDPGRRGQLGTEEKHSDDAPGLRWLVSLPRLLCGRPGFLGNGSLIRFGTRPRISDAHSDWPSEDERHSLLGGEGAVGGTTLPRFVEGTVSWHASETWSETSRFRLSASTCEWPSSHSFTMPLSHRSRETKSSVIEVAIASFLLSRTFRRLHLALVGALGDGGSPSGSAMMLSMCLGRISVTGGSGSPRCSWRTRILGPGLHATDVIVRLRVFGLGSGSSRGLDNVPRDCRASTTCRALLKLSSSAMTDAVGRVGLTGIIVCVRCVTCLITWLRTKASSSSSVGSNLSVAAICRRFLRATGKPAADGFRTTRAATRRLAPGCGLAQCSLRVMMDAGRRAALYHELHGTAKARRHVFMNSFFLR